MIDQESRPVRGDLLSCYTTSIAEYMEHHAINHQLVLGTQLFLAVHNEPRNPEKLSFVHYHTPLLGTHPTHSLHLKRRWSTTFEEAADRIAAQCQQFGATIVIGDAINLPWLVTYGRRHVPHWFIVTAINEQHQRMRIVDRFEFIDENGTQHPFADQVEQDLSILTLTSPVQHYAHQARNRWVFGTDNHAYCDTQESDTVQGYQWFEAVEKPESYPITQDTLRELLFKTYQFHTNQQYRSDLSSRDWYCGLDALRFLAQHFKDHIDDPLLYEYSDDLWVAARNRQMFTSVLKMLNIHFQLQEIDLLADWCEAYLIPQWEAVPRIMRYNNGCIQRGRKPKQLLPETFDKIVSLEEELMKHLFLLLRDYKLN